jgi:hypothetical protein
MIEESPLPCCPECRANQPFRLDCRHGPYPRAIITILSPWFLDNGASGIERQYLATTEVGGGNYSNLEFKPTRTLGGRQFTMLTPTTTKKGCFNAVGVPRLTVRYSVFTVKFLAMAYANSHALGITF